MTQYNEAVEEWQLEKIEKPCHIIAAGLLRVLKIMIIVYRLPPLMVLYPPFAEFYTLPLFIEFLLSDSQSGVY
jgi:hypothetical protein